MCRFNNCVRTDSSKDEPRHKQNCHVEAEIVCGMLGIEIVFRREEGGFKDYVCLCGLRMSAINTVVYHCRWEVGTGKMSCSVLQERAEKVLARTESDDAKESITIVRCTSTKKEAFQNLVKAAGVYFQGGRMQDPGRIISVIGSIVRSDKDDEFKRLPGAIRGSTLSTPPRPLSPTQGLTVQKE